MKKVLSFGEWFRVNEETTIQSQSSPAPKPATSKPVAQPKPATSKPAVQPVQTKPTTPQAKPVATKPVAKVNSVKITSDISNKIVQLFKTPANWEKFKGTFNDDEEAALKMFNAWWKSNVQPAISKLRPTDKNVQTITNLLPQLQKALLGNQLSDTVSWKIIAPQGMGKEYSVDTDF